MSEAGHAVSGAAAGTATGYTGTFHGWAQEAGRVRCELAPGSARIEVEDMGGPWRQRKPDDRPHGLDIVEALAGPDGWGTEVTPDQTRVVWAKLEW